DDEALRRGQVRLLELEAVFADGALVRARAGERGAPEARAVDEVMAPGAERLDVAVALPDLRDDRDNVRDDPDARFLPTLRRDVPDLCGGRTRVDLEVGAPNLRLLLGDEARRSGVQTIKIAELRREFDGTLVWDPSYIPPCLALSAAPGLLAELRELLSLALSRRRALVDLRHEHDPERAEFLGRDITHYLLLDALGGAIPALRHLLDEPRTHPLAAFLALSSFAGKLTSFATQVAPEELPSFRFVDLRASFGGLVAAIKEILGIAVEADFVRIPLTLRPEDGVWLGRLAGDALTCRAYVLAVESTLPQLELIRGLPRLSKIASWGRIGTHVKQATPGVRIAHLDKPPAEIPRRPRQIYFALLTDDPDWAEVLREQTLAIFAPEPLDHRRVRVELFGVRRGDPDPSAGGSR
ncbi:MAG: type VI secretion system baseplate subunit TssK, partial [Myxococcales bacterium]|nr:type VI secretion system baseplate subunit TssK [Myxococcales bacterium]